MAAKESFQEVFDALKARVNREIAGELRGDRPLNGRQHREILH